MTITNNNHPALLGTPPKNRRGNKKSTIFSSAQRYSPFEFQRNRRSQRGKGDDLLVMKKLLCGILIAFSIVASSCKKDPPKVETTPGKTFSNGVFVICEGNFTYGNAGATFYHRDTKQVETNIFQAINGYPMGDVFQSMYSDGIHYFLTVNNSQKIEVVDASTFKTTTSITGFNSPRYYLPYMDKAFVSDFGADGIWVLDENMRIKSKIATSGWTEQMVLFNEELFIAKVKNGYCILVIDPANEKIKDSIPVGEEPQWIVKDKEDKLWVLCNAYRKTKAANLHRIDPVTHKVLLTLSFPSTNDAPSRLKLNTTMDSVLFLDNGIYRMGINETSLPSQPLVKAGVHKYYGLGIDNATGIIYGSDALDFTQPGIVFRYRADGTPIDSFRTDPGPGDFHFVK